MSGSLAYLNCDFGVLSADNLRTHLEFLRQEMRRRTKILGGGSYGIVDSEDPQYRVDGAVRPLWPAFSVDSKMRVTVGTGIAVTPNGEILELVEPQTVDLAGLVDGAESLVLLRYSEVDSEEIGYSVDGVATSVGRVAKVELVSLTKAEYLDPTITTADVLENSVVMCVVQWATSEEPVLYTDQANGYYWNRPWFSPADVRHRNAVGTGAVTETNVHGLGLSDLAVGPLGIYEQLTTSGMIMSANRSVPGVPGYMCYDTFLASGIKRDNSGLATETSWFTSLGARYVELSAYPNTIFCAKNQDGDEIAIDYIPGTKLCVLVTDTDPETLTIWYSKTTSLSPAAVTENVVSFNGIDTSDIVITEGKPKTLALLSAVPVRKYGSVPREVTFKFTASGQVYADPSVLMATRGVSASVGAVLDVSATLPVPGQVGIGLSGLPSLPSSICGFEIIGASADGTPISESAYFDNTNYASAIVPADVEEDQQVHYTEQVFSSVSSVSVLSTGDYATTDVGDATFLVLARTDYTNARVCRLLTGFWDGESMQRVRDCRRILPTVRDGVYGYSSLHQAAEIVPGADDVLGTGSRAQLVAVEDFTQPTILNATDSIWDGLGYLDTPVIRASLASSSRVRRCYRSRSIPMRVNPASPLRLLVTLYGAEPTNSIGSVRVVCTNKAGRSVEGILRPVAGDSTGSLFAGFDALAWSSISLVISGRCKGFAAYFLRPDTASGDYFMEMV